VVSLRCRGVSGVLGREAGRSSSAQWGSIKAGESGSAVWVSDDSLESRSVAGLAGGSRFAGLEAQKREAAACLATTGVEMGRL